MNSLLVYLLVPASARHHVNGPRWLPTLLHPATPSRNLRGWRVFRRGVRGQGPGHQADGGLTIHFDSFEHLVSRAVEADAVNGIGGNRQSLQRGWGEGYLRFFNSVVRQSHSRYEVSLLLILRRAA